MYGVRLALTLLRMQKKKPKMEDRKGDSRDREKHGGAVSWISRYTRIYIRIMYLHCEMSIQKCVLENEYFVSCFAVSPSRLSATAALAVVDSSFSFLVNARYFLMNYCRYTKISSKLFSMDVSFFFPANKKLLATFFVVFTHT